MGGAVSSGRDNNELIDNLMSGNYIRTRDVERVFRALDRADYMTLEARDQAYKDLAWRNGPLHLSSPCIYSEVMEGLELKPGLSFLNIGSGTGYLSTLAGLILGSAGISHGVEVHPAVVEYAVKKLSQLFENSSMLDDFDFCEPKFYHGNGLCIKSVESGYDRVYCGAGCPDEYEYYFKRLIKVGGVLVMPLNDTLLQVRRVAADKWTSRSLLNVSFATLRVPTAEESATHVKLDRQAPVRLQLLARAVVRTALRAGVTRRHPELREAPRPPPPAAYPRRICIPIEPGGAVEGLNVLHDLESENGANEMNALLSLVISMGRNRVAGALRFDRIPHSESSEEEENQEQPENPDQSSNQEQPGDQERAGNLEQPTNGEEPNNEDRAEQGLPNNGELGNNRPGNGTNDDQSRNRPRNSRRRRDDDDDRPDDAERVGPSTVRDDLDIRSRVDADRRPNDTRAGASRSDRFDDRRPSNNTDDVKPNSIVRARRQRVFYNGSRELFALYEGDVRPSTSNETHPNSSDTGNNPANKIKEATDNDAGCARDTNGVPNRPDYPGIPSEVEIEFCKMIRTAEASTSTEMEWEEPENEAEGSEDETDTAKSRPKRQKLDSGIGENVTLTSSPKRTNSDHSDTDPSLTDTPVSPILGVSDADSWPSSPDKADDTRSEISIESDSATVDSEGCLNLHSRARSPSYWQPSAEELEHAARMRRRVARGGDARRVRLSYLMKQAVRELPLPRALKRYVNLDRCFEF